MKTKYYIILQPSIRAMGGEEMYTRNKVISASEHGYKPIVFHSGIGGKEVFIDDLKPYNKYEFSLFRYEPCIVPSYKKRRLVRSIKSILIDYDENSIIESHEILIAEWGEYLASQLGIRHFAYMLLEHNTLSFHPLYEFFRFKYERKELAGIVKATLPDMFSHYTDDVIEYCLPAYCSNVYENIPCPKQFKVGKADYTIGFIGRTNKSFVQPAIDATQRFITCHPNKLFNILYVGGSMAKETEKLVKERFISIPNARLTFTGMLFPLSTEMLQQMDVCIASAGSCTVSHNCGVPTISIDGNDNKAIGIYKRTTEHSLFRGNDEPPIEIESLLEEILIQKKNEKKDSVNPINIDFSSHWDFINEMSKIKDYFVIERINYPLKRKFVSCFLGFYYGLKAGGFASQCIGKLINKLR